MKTNSPITEIIKSRYSCRSYNGMAVENSKRENLNSFIEENRTSPFGTKPRFTVFAAAEKDNEALKGLGTYGFIKGASAFIVGAAKKSEYDLEDYGYLMEKTILYATDIGLGTCWLGGSFNKSVFSTRAQVGEGEYLPAVTAVGNTAERKRVVDSVMRFAVGATKRKPFHELFYDKNFSVSLLKDNSGEYETPLEMVRKAPSATNKQPWRIVCDLENNKLHFYLKRSKKYYENNKKYFGIVDLQRIDMGIAMCHFELAAKELNLNGGWEINNPEIGDLPEATEYLVSWE